MGRMKEQFGETTMSLGNVRRLGATRLLVACSPPCRHRAAISIDALRLSDDTPLADVATKKRFICAACDRRATAISVDWNVTAARPGDGR